MTYFSAFDKLQPFGSPRMKKGNPMQKDAPDAKATPMHKASNTSRALPDGGYRTDPICAKIIRPLQDVLKPSAAHEV